MGGYPPALFFRWGGVPPFAVVVRGGEGEGVSYTAMASKEGIRYLIHSGSKNIGMSKYENITLEGLFSVVSKPIFANASS